MRQQQFAHFGTIFCGRSGFVGKMRTRKYGKIPVRNGCVDVQHPLIFQAQKNLQKFRLKRGFRAGFICRFSASIRGFRGENSSAEPKSGNGTTDVHLWEGRWARAPFIHGARTANNTISLLTSVKQARASLGMSKACSAGAAGK